MVKHTLVLAYCLLLAGCADAPNRFSTQVIAHRGYWAAPLGATLEKSSPNSIWALELADRLGVYGSEFDVHLTRDNVPVIYHDGVLPDTEIEIQKTDYEKMKDFRLPNGEPLPRLDQYLKKGKKLSIMLIIELKEHENSERDREAARIIVDMVKEAVNSMDMTLEIAGQGADFITTDAPDKAKAVLAQYRKL